MYQRPLISVVVTTFRKEEFLEEALESVVAQSYQSWECIIIDDGSPDNDSEVARRIIAKYPNLKISLHRKENEGVAEARNSGIRLAQGDWIAPLDGDDKFAPRFLERAIETIGRDPALNHIVPDLQLFGAESEQVIYPAYNRAEMLFANSFFPYCSVFRRSLWENIGGYAPIIPYGAEDWNFWISISEHIVTARLQEPLVWYRKHTGGSLVDGVAQNHDEINAFIRTLHPEIYSAELLIEDYHLIARMRERTFAEVNKIIDRFPTQGTPHLWRGLCRNRIGLKLQAVRDFEVAASLATESDWQPFYWLARLYGDLKNSSRREEYIREALARHPRHFVSAEELQKLLVVSS